MISRLRRFTETATGSGATGVLARGSLGTISLRVASVFGVLALDILLARSLGQEEYDLLATGLSWMIILSMAATLGLGDALIRFLPGNRVREEFGIMAGDMRFAGRAMLATALGVSGVFAIFLCGAGGAFTDAQRSVLYVLLLAVPVHVMNLHRQAVLQAFKHPVLAFAPDQLVRPITAASLLLLLWALRKPVLAIDASWIWLASLGAALLIGTVFKNRNVPITVRCATPSCDRSNLIRVALPLGWIAFMRLLSTRADPAMIGWLGHPGEAALYAVADRIAMLLLFGLVAVSTVIAPLVSELHSTGRRAELQRMLTFAAKALTIFTLPLAAGLVVFGPALLGLFGPGFEDAYVPLVLLSGGQVVSALSGPVDLLLTMTGYHMIAARILSVCAFLKLGLNYAWIPEYGAVGAAAASLIMLVSWNVCLCLVVRKRIGVNSSAISLLNGNRWN